MAPSFVLRSTSVRRSLGLSVAIVFASSGAQALVWPDVPERIEHALAASDPVARRVAAHELQTLGAKRGAPLVLAALGDSDVEVRLAAAQSAIRLRIAPATEAVLPWLGDRETRLRIAACDVARALPNPRAIPQLARALGDSDAAVRAAAADALGSQAAHGAVRQGQASDDAVAPLLGKLDDASPPVRIQIARALARLGDARAVVPLVGKVQDSVPDVRQAVARALGELGDPRASQALILQLRDNVTDVRVEALGALGRLRAPDAVDAIAPLTIDRQPTLRLAAIAALGRIGTTQAVRALIAIMGAGDDAGGGLERTPVREALVSAGPAAIPELSNLLGGTPGTASAVSAAWVLGELHASNEAGAIVRAMRRGVLPAAAALHAFAGAGTRESVPIVLEFVGDASPLVRAEATRAAAALLEPSQPDGRAVEPLAAALRNAALSSVERASLVALLGRTGAPRAAPVLEGLVAAKDPALRLAAIDAIGTLGPAGVDNALLEKLSDSDAIVRLHAAVALGDSGSARARDALLAKMDSGDELDRAAFLTALGGILSRVPSEAAVTKLSHALELAVGPERDALIGAIGRTRTVGALNVLGNLSRSLDVDDRRTAATLLPVHASSAKVLARLLAGDADAGVRAQAAWSLGSIDGPEGIPLLEAIARGVDIDPAVNATAAIGRITARSKSSLLATRWLCPLLSDPRAHVRSNAAHGLGATGARCGNGNAERQLLIDDPVDIVRAAAASALLATPLSAEDRAALDHCAASERSSRVAHGCRTASAPVGAPHAVEVYVIADGASLPRPRITYALELADGFIRAGTADRRGAVFEPFAPDGEVSLQRPSAQAR